MTDARKYLRYPRRNDDAKAKRWRGPLFEDSHSSLMWKDGHYQSLERPGSVTFPICKWCSHIVWEWPHFEEAVPKNAICEVCAAEADRDA